MWVLTGVSSYSRKIEKHCPPYRTRKGSQAKEGVLIMKIDVICN